MPKTLRLRASNPQDIVRAADLLRGGGTVAFPTETVYGLGANALSPEAVARIFAAKQRPSWDPLIVHVASLADALPLIQLDEKLLPRVEALAAAFWPGPLTLLLPRRDHVPDAITAGRALVGIRVPADATAQALLRAAGLPLAAPSANRFGRTSPTTAQHVLDDLDGRIDAVLDGGPTAIGLESTVLDATTTPMTLYRPGGVSPEELARLGVPIRIFRPATVDEKQGKADVATQNALPAPGVGLRHYAPRAKLILAGSSEKSLLAAMVKQMATSAEVRVGVLLPTNWIMDSTHWLVEGWAPWDDAAALATTLFTGLRELDARGAEVIFCPLPEPGGLRDAIRDRLQKAARDA